MQAMLKMGKLELEALRRAFRGSDEAASA